MNAVDNMRRGRSICWPDLLRRIQIVFLLFLFPGLSGAVDAPRQWTSSDGRTLTASLLDVDRPNQRVTLKRADQAMFTLSWDQLSSEDVAWIRKTWGTRGTKYPVFSWDRVPLYAHFGIGAGLKPEQYDFLAEHFNLIGLTAGKGRQGNAELYTAKAARAIKDRNPEVKVLFYWASDKPKHQSTISNKKYPGEYLIHTKKRKGREDETTTWLDIESPEVQDWWVRAAVDAVTKYACDGIFVDGAVAGHPKGPLAKAFGPEKGAAMNEAMFSMLSEAREKMGPDKLMIYNPLHGYDEKKEPYGHEQLEVTDGAMVDDFDRGGDDSNQSTKYLVNTLGTLRKASLDGKIIVFKAWPRFTMNLRKSKEMQKNTPLEELQRMAREDIVFPLACFLLAAERNCYFSYTWGWDPEDGVFEWYPEFDKPLGPPKGNAVRDGFTFRREFQHASVFVDMEKKEGKIEWK